MRQSVVTNVSRKPGSLARDWNTTNSFGAPKYLARAESFVARIAPYLRNLAKDLLGNDIFGERARSGILVGYISRRRATFETFESQVSTYGYRGIACPVRSNSLPRKKKYHALTRQTSPNEKRQERASEMA